VGYVPSNILNTLLFIRVNEEIMRKSVLNSQDWFEGIEETPDNVIVDVPESIEADQYIIDNDFFDGDFFSIEMY
jgi:hypothetical protein